MSEHIPAELYRKLGPRVDVLRGRNDEDSGNLEKAGKPMVRAS